MNNYRFIKMVTFGSFLISTNLYLGSQLTLDIVNIEHGDVAGNI